MRILEGVVFWRLQNKNGKVQWVVASFVLLFSRL